MVDTGWLTQHAQLNVSLMTNAVYRNSLRVTQRIKD